MLDARGAPIHEKDCLLSRTGMLKVAAELPLRDDRLEDARLTRWVVVSTSDYLYLREESRESRAEFYKDMMEGKFGS